MNAVAKMPKPAKERGRIAPKKFSHIVLRTKAGRVATLLDWYKNVLEAEATFENEMLGFVTYDQEHHRVAVLGLPDVGDHVDMTCGLHHFAFTYESLVNLVQTYQRLKNEYGIEPQFCINHGPTTSMYYFDPDKNQIELQVDNIPEEKFAEYFDNGEFAENPIGVRFDPEDLIARLEAGVPESELLQRPAGAPPDVSEFPVN